MRLATTVRATIIVFMLPAPLCATTTDWCAVKLRAGVYSAALIALTGGVADPRSRIPNPDRRPS
jgi:hypothetical protein